jgi:predicted MFS family arabinose efflux permease
MSNATLAPFRTRSFRFQWPADLCTAWAMEMETLILGWYVLVETGSVLLLTVFGSLLYLGTLLSPLLGTVADRLGLRRVLTVMRVSYAVFAAMILAMALSGHMSPVLVLIVAGLAGLVKPTDIGMRSAMVGATVPPEHLTAAMGVSRTTMDSAKIGGALAGTGVVALAGMAPAYALVVALYLLGALLTLGVDPDRQARRPGSGDAAAAGARASRPSALADLREGLTYVWRTPRLLAAMSVAGLVNLTAYPLTIGLLPYLARDVFKIGQQGLGWLVISFAAGALVGSIAISVLGARLRPAWTMLAATLVWHLFLVGVVLAPSPALAMALLACAGVCQSLSMLTLSILLLRTSEARFRGRIMGVRMLAIYPLPIGILIAGALIERIGYMAAELTMLSIGLVLIAAIVIQWRRDLLPRDAPGNAG